MTTIEIFKKMYDWLCANRGIVNQAEVARAAGLNEVTVSRILHGQVKKASMETLHKVNAAFDNVFNPAWLRGESNLMLTADTKRQHITQTDTDVQGLPFPASSALGSDALTVALLASKDETIAAQKRELVAKDALIVTLQQQLSDLRAQLAMEKGLSTGPFPSVPADLKQHPPKNI